MMLVDERLEIILPTIERWFKWHMLLRHPNLLWYRPDIYHDIILHVLLSRQQIEKALSMKRNSAERRRVFKAYIMKMMERAANDSAVYYASLFSKPKRHEYKKITAAFVPEDDVEKRIPLDDERVSLQDNSPTEECLLFYIELERATAGLSAEARELLFLRLNKFRRNEIMKMMGITLWSYRTLMQEVQEAVSYLK